MKPTGRGVDLRHNLRACGDEDHHRAQTRPQRRPTAAGAASARRSFARARLACVAPDGCGQVKALPLARRGKTRSLKGSVRPSSACRSPGSRRDPRRAERPFPQREGDLRRERAGSRKNGTRRMSERKKQRLPNVSLCRLLYTGLVRSHVHVSGKTTASLHCHTTDSNGRPV